MKSKTISLISQAACMLMAMLMAAGLLRAVSAGSAAYSASRQALDTVYTTRTLMDYISARVRGGNARGMVYPGELDGLPCLCIDEELEGDVYTTYIYCQDGSLKELFCQKGLDLTPDDGTELLNCDQLAVSSAAPGLLSVTVTSSGTTETGYVHILEGGAR